MAMGDGLQPLPSSLRRKQRYVVFDLLSDEQHQLGAVVDAVWDAVLELLGERGAAEADPWILKDLFDADRQRGAIRVHKDSVTAVRAALALITLIDGTDTTVQVVGVTGTMDSAEEKYLA
jgi:ribonuclease P/MRP protein subunit POP5